VTPRFGPPQAEQIRLSTPTGQAWRPLVLGERQVEVVAVVTDKSKQAGERS